MAILSRSVKRLDKTIHSLIEILDMQDQDKQIVKELNFASLFQETAEEYHQFIEESEAVIQTDFEAAPDILYIEAYLQSLFSNLLSNSLKYRDPERPLTISIATEPMAGGIRFRFADTGAGMDLDLIKDRLFRPFTRFSSGSSGKGIGLYLIKGMVEGNGGTVIVESTVGKGTAFVFTLVPHQ
jgi:signal transduction histidine kinase